MLSVKAVSSLTERGFKPPTYAQALWGSLYFFDSWALEEYLYSHKIKQYFMASINKKAALEIKEEAADPAKWLGKPWGFSKSGHFNT